MHSDFETILRAALRGEAAAVGADLLPAADEHRVAPFLFAWLSAAGATAPPELRDRALHAAAVEPFRLADLREVLAALETAGVRALVVKGTALAYRLYPSAELRPRGDTDLLVDHAALPAARAVFASLGFHLDLIAPAAESYARGGHIYDVHWSIANNSVFAEVLPIDALFERSVPLPEVSPDARTIDDVDALLYACIHRVAHHHHDERLIWLADVHLLRARMSPDEHRRFWEAAAAGEIIGICARAIELANHWFGGGDHDLASDWLPAARVMRAERSQRWLDPSRARGALFASELAATRGWRARAGRLRQLAFPPRSMMREQFRTRSRLLLPWLYAWRGVRGVARLFRRVA
jgi:hypothetical protein